VLPFENLSRDPDNAYFADGIQDEILTRLAKIADLKVISRTPPSITKARLKTCPKSASNLALPTFWQGACRRAATPCA
jgi:TolB-like protein